MSVHLCMCLSEICLFYYLLLPAWNMWWHSRNSTYWLIVHRISDKLSEFVSLTSSPRFVSSVNWMNHELHICSWPAMFAFRPCFDNKILGDHTLTINKTPSTELISSSQSEFEQYLAILPISESLTGVPAFEQVPKMILMNSRKTDHWVIGCFNCSLSSSHVSFISPVRLFASGGVLCFVMLWAGRHVV